MNKSCLRNFFIAAAITSTCVAADPNNSWNLSRDMLRDGLTTNPFGNGNVWTLMYDTNNLSHDSSAYTPMPYNYPNFLGLPWNYWISCAPGCQSAVSAALATSDLIAYQRNGVDITLIKGIPNVHPGPLNSAIIRWQSPISGKITISGRITDNDGTCGNGIKWYADSEGTTLLKGVIRNGLNNGTTLLKNNVNVSIGSSIYFIVNANGDVGCDSTYVDVNITSP